MPDDSAPVTRMLNNGWHRAFDDPIPLSRGGEYLFPPLTLRN